MIEISNKNPIIRLYASEKHWIEGDALQQLRKTAELEGIEKVVGMPDLHPGGGTPIGAAFVSKNILYPYLIGNDVGCGIGLWKTTLKANKVKRDKWARKLSGLELPWGGDIKTWMTEHAVGSLVSEHDHGSLGGGNHFAELQKAEKIFDEDEFRKLGLEKKNLALMVHSGSRSLGEAIFRRHTTKHGAKGLNADSNDAINYIKQHDTAIKWAASNRELIARRFVSQLGGNCKSLLDMCHNSISQIFSDKESKSRWLHRKGVIPADEGPVVIPGSRGTLSFLVKPIGSMKKNAWSLAHGAGRKWNRNTCKDRLKSKYNSKSLTQTTLGSIVICEEKELLYEEAPQAYKNIDNTIGEMIDDGLISLIATFRPLITYKTRKKR